MHVVSIFMANSCSIKHEVIVLLFQNYCYFMLFCVKGIFLHHEMKEIEMS